MVNLFKTLFILFTTLTMLFLFSLLITNCKADDYHIIDLDELRVDYKNYGWINKNNRNLLIYPDKVKESLNLAMKLSLLKITYIDPTIESLTDSGQYRSIGLDFHLGVRATNFLDLGYYHHSQHVLERAHSFLPKFPVEDAVEFRLYLIRKEKKDSIF